MVGKRIDVEPTTDENLAEALRGAYPELDGDRATPPSEPVYLVGGAVRDLLLGRGARRPRPRRRRRRRARWRRGSAPKSLEHERFATARSSSTATRSTSPRPAPRPTRTRARCPRSRPARSIEADLARRDFTVNAIAIPLARRAAPDRPVRRRGRPRGRACCGSSTPLVRRRPDPGDARRPLRRPPRLRAGAGDRGAAAGDRPRRRVSADRREAELLRLAGEPSGPRGFGLLAEWGLLELRAGGRRAGRRGSPSCSAAPPWRGAVAPRDRARPRRRARTAPGGERGAGRRASPPRPSEAVALAAGHDPVELVARPARSAPSGSTTTWREWREVALEIGGEDLIAAGVAAGPGARPRPGGGPASASSTASSSAAASEELAAARSAARRRGDLLSSAMDWRESEGVRWLEADLPAAPAPRSRPASAASARRPSRASTSASSPTTPTTRRREPAPARRGARARRRSGSSIGRQVHGAELAATTARSSRARSPSRARDPRGRRPRHRPRPGLAALVFVADCLPVALAGPGGVGDAALRLARARRRDRRRAAPRRSAPPPPRSAPGSGPAATRSATRCSPPSPPLGDGLADGPHARPRRGRAPAAARGRGRADRGRRPLHELRGGAVLLPPPRRRPHRPPGRARSGSRRAAEDGRA